MVDKHTVFRLESVSKGFFSALNRVLVENGVFGWDCPITGYLDTSRLNDSGQTHRVQIRYLLSNISGFPRQAYTNHVKCGLPLDHIIPRL